MKNIRILSNELSWTLNLLKEVISNAANTYLKQNMTQGNGNRWRKA